MSEKAEIIQALKNYYLELAQNVEYGASPSEMIHLATFLLNMESDGTPVKNVANECAINVVVDDTQLDRVIAKANSLKETLLEAKSLGYLLES